MVENGWMVDHSRSRIRYIHEFFPEVPDPNDRPVRRFLETLEPVTVKKTWKDRKSSSVCDVSTDCHSFDLSLVWFYKYLDLSDFFILIIDLHSQLINTTTTIFTINVIIDYKNNECHMIHHHICIMEMIQ